MSHPLFRLGGNLFYRQGISGKSLLSKEFRIAIGLRGVQGEVVSSLLLQVLDQKTLRIRQVSTDLRFQKKGYATKLLIELLNLLKKIPFLSFTKIEVWAAPEIQSIFKRVGFLNSLEMAARPEPIYDIKKDRLLSSERELQPMYYLLR